MTGKCVLNINEKSLYELIYLAIPQEWNVSYIEWIEYYYYMTYNGVNYKIDTAMNVNLIGNSLSRDNSCLFLESLLKRTYFKTL